MSAIIEHEDWLKAVIARPHDEATRAAFLDWLQETDPERCDPARGWWRDFSQAEGWWSIEPVYDGSTAGEDRYWIVLIWGTRHGSGGLGMTSDRTLLPACSNCGDRSLGWRGPEGGAWVCDTCVLERDRLREYGGLVPSEFADGSPSGKPAFDEIPF